MKGLRKYLTPFAPDQSGAVSVLYELGGLVVICDAGGCAGNVCGFDEPRWHTMRSAVFSAGLRDMDAIMGRDKKLVAELVTAARALEPDFAAVVGTPVPAVIGTDYTALRRMAERELTIPVLTVDTNGMQLYDKGAEKAYLALFKTFAAEKLPVKPGLIGVLGVNPLDMSMLDADKTIASVLISEGAGEVRCYGMGGSLEDVRRASEAEKNIVVSPSGLKAARYLEQTFGTPFEVRDPLAAPLLDKAGLPDDLAGRKILVCDQQVRGDSMRKELLSRGASAVTVATWFMPCPPCQAAGDVRLKEEDDFTALAENYDIVIGDPVLQSLIPCFAGAFISIVSFPVSGKLMR